MDGIFLQQLVNGLTLGSVYGLIAIGYTMVYGIIGMINFAHGEVYMISAYLAAISLALLAYFGIESFPLLILGTLIFTVVVTGVYGWVIERVAYKPLRNSTRLAPLISAIGISLILQNYAQIAQGAKQQGIPTLLAGAWRVDFGTGFVQLTYTKVFILVAAFAGMALLTYVIKYTKLGRMCRATQQDRKMASILGINTDRLIVFTFFISSVLGGLAGTLVGLSVSIAGPYFGIAFGLKGLAVIVLGGLGNIPGTMLGGLLIGLAESFVPSQHVAYRDAVPFALLFVVLLVRPYGLLGQAGSDRA